MQKKLNTPTKNIIQILDNTRIPSTPLAGAFPTGTGPRSLEGSCTNDYYNKNTRHSIQQANR
jgi:hypothetical protein